eukprot:COSAG01_NODE_58630_length_305_cov_0.436893_1_plen_92_part_01
MSVRVDLGGRRIIKKNSLQLSQKTFIVHSAAVAMLFVRLNAKRSVVPICRHLYSAETGSRKSKNDAIIGFFKQKTAYEILRSDWSSDVCSSD